MKENANAAVADRGDEDAVVNPDGAMIRRSMLERYESSSTKRKEKGIGRLDIGAPTTTG